MTDRARVALVNMPFSFSKYPSIQLGTLSALLKSKGIPVQIARESGQPVSFFEDMSMRTAPQFLTGAMTAIDWGRYKIVGFTSTFDQNVASRR